MRNRILRWSLAIGGAAIALLLSPALALASEADLVLPAGFAEEKIAGFGVTALLWIAMGLCVLGMTFGAVMYARLRNLPVHAAMREVSELIYATCKAYLRKQARFIFFLWVLLAGIIVLYFGVLEHKGVPKVLAILAASVIGIAGSFGVAWFGIRINTFANSRAAFASLKGKGFPCYSIPLSAGMSIGMLLISIELFLMIAILMFPPPDYAGPCFIGFAIGESLGAAALRIAGGIFTKIADIGSDLMKIVLKIKEDDARNPGVIADCTGDNAGDSVGPTADGFETYGVTGVALITFILLAVPAAVQTQLLVWIFLMRAVMLVASPISYWINEAWAKARYGNADTFDYEAPLSTLVWVATVVSVAATYALSKFLIPEVNGDTTVWWKLATVITCGTLAGAIIPEVVKVFTSTRSGHVKEVLESSRQGGASLNILSGLTAGNFSTFWLTLIITGLMGVAYWVSTMQLDAVLPVAPAVFAFGLVAFGFLSLGPVTIALDSYGPVTDNAQSIYELSLIETVPNVSDDIQKNFGFTPNFQKAKHLLEEADAAGNTFKATAKPVLIGTAVVGATTLIFSIIMVLTDKLASAEEIAKLSIVHPPFLLGLMLGGAMIYWFSGASTQAVVVGAYRAVEFIRANIKLDEGATKASQADSERVVEICTEYAQKGMFTIFLAVFFATLSVACLDPHLFIGYLVATAIVGLYQAVFMANAGGAWDNAKKLCEVGGQKGTELHDATVVGDTVGDPFKDTSSVALNPVIKFSTLFGLLAVELAISLTNPALTKGLSIAFGAITLFFVWRSFYGMRIQTGTTAPARH